VLLHLCHRGDQVTALRDQADDAAVDLVEALPQVGDV
jgi:hypothetical protein